jgi:hypothetical protein
MRFLSWKKHAVYKHDDRLHIARSTMLANTAGGRTDECEIEVTSVAQLGSSFLLRKSRIKLHLQQWNRLNRATRATRFLNLNLIRRLSRGVEQQ